LLKELFELFKSAFEPVVLRHVYEIIENGVIDSNVDVTVLNGDT
jgi:hypothetical protein